MDRRLPLIIVCLLAVEQNASSSGLIQERAATVAGSSMFFYRDQVYLRDCQEVQEQCSIQNSTKTHLIRPDGYHEPFWVSCSGEWTVFQRRLDGFLDFTRNWTQYQDGFGYLNVEHWLGNKKLSLLTNQKNYELRIEIETKSGVKAYLSYGRFRINDEFGDYALVGLGQYTVTLDSSTIMGCPANMIFGNCSSCIATCADPSGTVDCSNDCTDAQYTCICPTNYLMNGTSCVRSEQCGCYKAGYGVVEDNGMMSDCSERCECNSGVLTCVPSACDCYELFRRGNATIGDYTITPIGWTDEPFTVNCNMTIGGGGWTVFQRRIHSSSRLSFDRNWAEYKNGFGTHSGEFWLGNDKLAWLTNQKEYELRIDMVNGDHSSYYAEYDYFLINGEEDKYRLADLGDFSGTAAFDGMRYHQGVFFSTTDRDNDLHETPTTNCADSHNAGWWYYKCYYCDMNYGASSSYAGYWYYLPGDDYLFYSEMKIRPKEANQ